MGLDKKNPPLWIAILWTSIWISLGKIVSGIDNILGAAGSWAFYIFAAGSISYFIHTRNNSPRADLELDSDPIKTNFHNVSTSVDSYLSSDRTITSISERLTDEDIIKLGKLADLRDRGILTDDEFRNQKALVVTTQAQFEPSVQIEGQKEQFVSFIFSGAVVPMQLPSGEIVAIRNKTVPELVRVLTPDQLVTADPIAELLRPDGHSGKASLWDVGHAVPGLDRGETARSFVPWTFLTPTPDTPHYLG